MYAQEEDTSEHILVQCVTAREVWFGCAHKLNLSYTPPTQDDTLQEWWLQERARFRPKERKGFDGLVVTKILVSDRKKIPRGVGIAGYRGYRKIPSGYRTNLKSKI
jgi:hypothetical protein